MTAAAKEARASYMREWRKRNPQKQREYDAAKWERKAEQLKQEADASQKDKGGGSIADQ